MGSKSIAGNKSANYLPERINTIAASVSAWPIIEDEFVDSLLF